MADIPEGEGAPHAFGGRTMLQRLRALWLPFRRLASDIDAYESDLRGRARLGENRGQEIKNTLEGARTALNAGDVDRGWKLLQTARRLELLDLKGAELEVMATEMRNEAGKLNTWRKNAVTELLSVKDGQDEELSARLHRAAWLRDEHYNNEAYKDSLRRRNALWLAIVLIIVLLVLLGLAYKGYLCWTTQNASVTAGDCPFNALLSIVVVGLLGATISAMTDAPPPQSPARIPEMVSTIRVTALRLLMGPASAVVIYFAIKSNLYDYLFKFGHPDGYTILVIAFVAGFTERLVLRVVETIAGKSAS